MSDLVEKDGTTEENKVLTAYENPIKSIVDENEKLVKELKDDKD